MSKIFYFCLTSRLMFSSSPSSPLLSLVSFLFSFSFFSLFFTFSATFILFSYLHSFFSCPLSFSFFLFFYFFSCSQCHQFRWIGNFLFVYCTGIYFKPKTQLSFSAHDFSILIITFLSLFLDFVRFRFIFFYFLYFLIFCFIFFLFLSIFFIIDILLDGICSDFCFTDFFNSSSP